VIDQRDMELKRRFVFRGNAAAFGGRIVRPNDMVLVAKGASSLTVSGGESKWSDQNIKFGDSVRIDSAMTSAVGRFDDTDKLIAKTFHKVPEDSLTATTTVKAGVKGLVVGGTPQFTVQSVHVSMTSKSPTASSEPSIRLDDETGFDVVKINGHEVEVSIAHDLFKRYDTRAKLLSAADDEGFVKEHGHHFHMHNSPERRRAIRSGNYIIGTIVRRLKWKGAPMDNARIDDNSIVVKDFGTVYFGEILITAVERRVSMLRFELGSPEGGDVVCAEVGTNGVWSN
jgi:hypothetical protein